MYLGSLRNTYPQLVKRLKLGVILYYLYYVPKGFLQRCFQRGLINIALDAIAQQRMEKATYHLPVIESHSSIASLEVHFLTGKRFWYQTCFCAYSLAQQTSLSICPIIYSDGSLEQRHQNEIRRIFPNVKIHLQKELDDRINTYLPKDRFPYLNERRQNYPNIRKLIDIHVGSTGWKLVLDSDMLFFRDPGFLINWLRSPQQPCCMIDTETAYGYSNELMAELAGANIPDRLNVGICGLKSEDIYWEQLEFWCKTSIEQQGTHYYQEQALVAMLMAGKLYTVAPAEEYIVMPDREEVIQPKAILHHYVADSKPLYFRYGWKHVLSNDNPSTQMRQAS
jgi:hypothetical protein